MEKLRLSSSKINTFLHCRQKYVWEYIEELTPKETAQPLQVGTIVHDLLHLYYSKELTAEKILALPDYVMSLYPENEADLSMEIAQYSAELFQGYLNKFKNDPLQVIASEVWAEYEFDDYILSGRVDAIAKKESRYWRVEHKTAKQTDSAYLSGLKAGLQGSIYDFFAEKLFEEPIAGTIYNLIIKTKIPKYERQPAMFDYKAQKRTFECIKGVVADIKQERFYPSCDCYKWFRPCEFLPLCSHYSEDVKKAFYKKRISPLDRKEGDIIKLNK